MEKHHEQIYRQIENYYQWLTDRLPSRQDALFKTYLWSASLAMGLNLALLKGHKLLPFDLWTLACLVSLALAFLVLIYCIDSLRGKTSEDTQHPDYMAYLGYLENPDYDKDETMKTLASQFMDFVHHQRAIQSQRAIKLRISSICLVLSFTALAIAGVVIAIP